MDQHSIEHSFVTNSQAWCFALRKLMGYPCYAPAFHTTAWCSSGPRDLAGAIQLTDVATDMGRDIVHVAFELNVVEPLAVSLAVRRGDCMEWIPGMRLFASGETARIELLARNRRWFIGPRQMLISAKLPPKGRRARGEEIAMRRWRQAVAAMEPLQIKGSVWVPPGGTYADAIPQEMIKVAA